MSILCAIDFSPVSLQAAEVGAALALRRQLPLHLVYALSLDAGELFASQRPAMVEGARARLEQEARRLAAVGVPVQGHVVTGSPEEALLESAREHRAQLLMVGATGQAGARERLLGTIAERLVRQAHLPTWVVRRPEALEAWLTRRRALRVLVGVDATPASMAAWGWATQLAQAAPVELVRTCVYWPPEQFARLGLSGVRSYVDPDPEVHHTLRRELEERFVAPPGVQASTLLWPGLGNVGDQLAVLAREQEAGLLVVGRHPRSPLARLWEGSVSRGALHHSAVSVVCVPGPEGAATREVPPLRSVLAATDFSGAGNAAVEHALAYAGAGDPVHLVHVLEPRGVHSTLEPHDIFSPSAASRERVEECTARLRALVPPSAGTRGVRAQVHVLESSQPAEAIAQAAERLGVGLLCLGAHGRQGLKRLALGSVAQGVLAHTHRPVLLVQEPRA